ncbi:MAG: DUF2950 family protein [Rhodopila sp.]|nr:DUF2950 family protein [Rhodopila sp.]
MITQLLRIAACGLILHGTSSTALYTNHASAQTTEVQAFNSEQLDALLAPVALYPDALLTQLLMASTFPLQVVSAWRWVDDPANKSLSGDALAKAIEPQTWDPSVKSLVPFPQVLAMMNGNLDWTQQLGYAFADQQAAVMNSVQRLRAQAKTAGNLQTTEQQVVRTEQQTIIIEPAQPTVVYVPSYNPTVVYGAWPYPSYPPVYLPPPPGYVVGTALVSGLAFAAGVAVVGSLWGWARPGWGGGYVNVNVNRYNNINVNRTQINSNVWQANRPGGRPAGLQRAPGGPVGQPARANGLPVNAVGRPSVNVPASAVNRPAKPATTQTNLANRPGGTNPGQANTGNRPNVGQGAGNRSAGNAPASPGPGARPAGQRPAPARQPEAFKGMDNGQQATQFSARGNQSRAASQGQGQRQGGVNVKAGSTPTPAPTPRRARQRGAGRLVARASEDRTMTRLIQRVAARASLGAIAGLALVMGAYAAGPAQQSYASPNDAVAALVAAARSHDEAALHALLGPGSEALVSSGDRYADEEALRRFVASYDANHALVPEGTDRMVLDIGTNDWPLPIPIVRREARWYFDSHEGAQEIIDRRIGRNEIAAIRVSLAYVDAQNDYFARRKEQTGGGEYAQRLVSTQGKHDGLYWPAAAGQEDSPLEPLVAQTKEEGYPGEMLHGKLAPYQGYFFRILYAQGAEAPDGAKKYVQNGRMIGGFALIAWPASYASSGIMSFIVDQDGVVFQKDLGPETARLAANTAQFDPDPSWARVNVTDQ